MSFIQAVGTGFRSYFDFRGRSSRSEFWWWILFTINGYIVFTVLDIILGLPPLLTYEYGSGGGFFGFSFFISISYGVMFWMSATFLPGLAVASRRLHDVNLSSWLILVGLIPFLGIMVLILLVLPSEQPYVRLPNDKKCENGREWVRDRTTICPFCQWHSRTCNSCAKQFGIEASNCPFCGSIQQIPGVTAEEEIIDLKKRVEVLESKVPRVS